MTCIANLSASADRPAIGFIPTRQSLLSRLRDLGDDRSWHDFFDTYWKLIYNAAVRAGLSDAEAQDVVQETVLTVTRRIGDFTYDPAVGSFKGWLLQITRWRILDHLRKQNRAGAAGAAAANGPARNELEIADSNVSALDALWEAEWQQNLVDAAVRRVKQQVKPKQYQIFELYAVKEWPAEKVARTMGVSIGQVHLAHHRISKQVKNEVERLQAKGY
jgi:RNA polymerase sigma factor (sigma-70 family)